MLTWTRIQLLLAFVAVGVQLVAGDEDIKFNPREYEDLKKSAICKAIKRSDGNKAVNILMTYVDINPGEKAKGTLVMAHGWPSLWSSWGKQIEEFKNDYRLIVPDLRGFGDSSHPDDPKSSHALFDHVGDLACIMEKEGIENAVCVGHDWGSSVCYEAGRSRPDLFNGVVGVAVPYIPSAGPFTPIKALTPTFKRLTYQIYFDEKTYDAIAELNKDMRRTLRATLRSKANPTPPDYLTSTDNFLGAYKDAEIEPIVLFTADEEDYWVEQYSKQGFNNTLGFYTQENRYAHWKFAHEQGNHTIPSPVLAIYPTDDPVADWVAVMKIIKSEVFLPRLTVEVIEGSHWVHMENYKLANKAIRDWLENVHAKATPKALEKDAEEKETIHNKDEL